MGIALPSTQNTTEISRIEEPIRPPETAGLFAHDLFGRDSRGESFSTLCTATLQDCSPRLRLHSFSEAVFTEALDPTRLECPLHRCGTSLSVICLLNGLLEPSLMIRKALDNRLLRSGKALTCLVILI
jgi:hypothetical protein